MAYISKEIVIKLKNSKILEKSDIKKLAALSRDKGLQKGKGFTAQTFRNVLYHQFTTTDEVTDFIFEYLEKKASKKNRKEREFLDKIAKKAMI